MGTPTESTWPGVSSKPNFIATCPQWRPCCFHQLLPGLEFAGRDLLTKMLQYHPAKRIEAKCALEHPYFYEITQSQLPRFVLGPVQDRSSQENRNNCNNVYNVYNGNTSEYIKGKRGNNMLVDEQMKQENRSFYNINGKRGSEMLVDEQRKQENRTYYNHVHNVYVEDRMSGKRVNTMIVDEEVKQENNGFYYNNMCSNRNGHVQDVRKLYNGHAKDVYNAYNSYNDDQMMGKRSNGGNIQMDDQMKGADGSGSSSNQPQFMNYM
eukprot:TRINITY_DN3111_c0_g1_i1.p2 TRINITY_DN3111_c0_g1~~TRINITY_DN3111_c0_g1_i1.p2  ORF type:complete len:289 (-),score=25.94 TRINITY_DN3111_c0_g1_i1:724-1518(-)